MKIANKLKKIVKSLLHLSNSEDNHIQERLRYDFGDTKMLTAKTLINQMRLNKDYNDIPNVEFKVFSQFGEDGVIQYLINNIDIDNKTFIEFGVENYTESNTRFLLLNDNWKGLVIDSNKEYIDFIKSDSIYWKHELTVHC